MDKELRAEAIERTLSAHGWHLVGVSYLDAADELEAAGVKLRFEAPVRALYAHAWELNLKACLRQQGLEAEEVRENFGHNLLKIWDAIDRERFPLLDLRDELRDFVSLTAFYHRNRLYAYPLTGWHSEPTLEYLRAVSSRFRLARPAAVQTFGMP